MHLLRPAACIYTLKASRPNLLGIGSPRKVGEPVLASENPNQLIFRGPGQHIDKRRMQVLE